MLYELCDMGEWKTKDVLLKELKENGIEVSRIRKKLRMKGNLKLVINENNLLVVEE
jgi:hypothetical protein